MRASSGVKLSKFDGNGSLETFLVKFENHAGYFNWSDRDRLFHLKNCLEGAAGQILWNVDPTVSFTELVRILRNRFGSEQQAERFALNCEVDDVARGREYKNCIKTFDA